MQTSINNKELGLLVKKQAENLCKDNTWSSFFCVLALSFVIYRPTHLFYVSYRFQKHQKMFNENSYRRERCNSNKCFVLLWTCLYKKTNHLSLNDHVVPLLNLLMSTENKQWHREKVGGFSRAQMKMEFFFSERIKKNNETTEQEANKSLNWKEIMSPEPFPFKNFPSNTMTKITVFFSHLKSQKKLNHQQ